MEAMDAEITGPEVAIVILNFNGKEFLERFLPSIIKHSAGHKVIVADNASQDGSMEMMHQKFPDIQVLQNSSNLGFAEGYNQALKKIKAKYYILLNSDIEVKDQWVEPVIKYMEQHTEVAACQPKIRSFHRPEFFEYAGAAGGFIDRYGYPFCRGRIFQSIEKDHGQYDDIKDIFWASGACMFVRSEIYHKAGGLDKYFFAHMEEIDFCWRLKNMGYKIQYIPLSVVYHIGGGTLPKSSARKTYLNFRNNFSLIFKNLPSKQLMPILISRLFLDGIAAWKFLAEGHWGDFIAVFRAHLYFYIQLPRLIKLRKKLTQNKVSNIYMGNIAAAHFLAKKNKFSELDQNRFSCYP